METESTPIDRQTLEAMNEKAIQNQFFTPDRVYIDLALFKDIPVGVVFADHMLKDGGEVEFNRVQTTLLKTISEYQKRIYDTVEPFFDSIGYTDDHVDGFLKNIKHHDLVFAMAPATKFLDTLIRHTIRNQNNSRPAAKYTKKMLDKDQYVMEPVPVTYHLNTYPLTLSPNLLLNVAKELGESLGVNIKFLNKNPTDFDQGDWDDWMETIDCFYLNSLGQFTRSDFVLKKQEDLAFMGCYFFARKRFEKCVMAAMRQEDFEHQIQIVTAQLDILCDFAWLQNNDVRLTENKEDVPLDIPDEKDGTKS